jgi:hypothetical protein
MAHHCGSEESLITHQTYEDATKEYIDVKKKCENPARQRFLTIWLLPLHAVLVIILAISLIKYVDCMLVNPSNANRKSDGKTLLRASDVTTIISFATVVIRLVTSSWCSIAAWRCAFILLEAGLDLQQFSRTVSWRMPTEFKGQNSVTVTLVLLLIFPSTVITPIVTGAIDWQAAFSFKDGGSLMSVLVGANSSIWYWYLWHDQGSRI